MHEVKFIKENFGTRIFIAETEQGKVFVKEALTDEGQGMILREYNNQKFLFETSQKMNLGFVFLEPRLEGNKLILSCLDENYKWLGNIANKKTIEPLEKYLEPMIIFLKACQKINLDDLPEAIKEDGRLRKQHAFSKISVDLDYLISVGVLEKKFKAELISPVERILDKNAFQHHDVVPWHMAKNQITRKIVLIDSGWAGISFALYDAAYFILQMIGYGEREDEAKKFISALKEDFSDSTLFDELLSGALAYRGGAFDGRITPKK